MVMLSHELNTRYFLKLDVGEGEIMNKFSVPLLNTTILNPSKHSWVLIAQAPKIESGHFQGGSA